MTQTKIQHYLYSDLIMQRTRKVEGKRKGEKIAGVDNTRKFGVLVASAIDDSSYGIGVAFFKDNGKQFNKQLFSKIAEGRAKVWYQRSANSNPLRNLRMSKEREKYCEAVLDDFMKRAAKYFKNKKAVFETSEAA